MNVSIYISDGLSTMLAPFQQFWNPSYCIIKCESVGFEQWNTDAVFYDSDDNIMEIPESDDIRMIVDLWDEYSFDSLIHNQFIDHIFQNMRLFGINEHKVNL